MKKEFKTFSEVEAFVNPLFAEKKWAIAVGELKDGSGYEVRWIEHKFYTARDGNSYPDEIWTTLDGGIKCIQDLEPEHARNILRMLLRNGRAQDDAIQELIKGISQSVQGTDEDIVQEPATHILH